MSLGSLAAYAPDTDSEHERDDHDDRYSGSDDEFHKKPKNSRVAELADQDSRPSSVTSQSSKTDVKKVSRLVSYGADELATDDEEEEMDLVETDDDQETAITETVPAEEMGLEPGVVPHLVTDDVRIPPEPPGRCSRHLQEKINKFYLKMRSGQDLNKKIQDRKDFRNPSIYEKLIQFCGIDEKGTNYPPEIYNPRIFGKDSYYDELARVQKLEMEKREKERKERTKVEFVTGTKRPSSAQGQNIPDAEKRKSKWDAQPVRTGSGVSLSQPGAIPVTTVPADRSSKPTVISAVGTIKKK